MNTKFLTIKNASVVSLDDLLPLSEQEFRNVILQEKKDRRIVSYFAWPISKGFQLILCLGDDPLKQVYLFSTVVEKSFLSLTPDFPQAQLFECEIHEQYGIIFENHPCLKGVRHYEHDIFSPIQNPSIHEVAVGPVHAGIIEPGHFRFQCDGELVNHLEIALGYQYRGIEKALIEAPHQRTIHFMETLAGDTSIGHTMAYCQMIESLSEVIISQKSQLWRAIALELERLANHTGDLGALANDIGFLPTAAFCGRLRGDFLNFTAEICGNRFGRNFICPGGITMDCDQSLAKELIKKFQIVFRDTIQAIDLLWKSSSVLTRFQNTGIIRYKMGQDLGLVGVAARSSGIKQDVRIDFPFGIYQTIPIEICLQSSGDVYARAFVRYLEIQKSGAYILHLLQNLLDGPHYIDSSHHLKPRSIALSMIEGWRGEICHIGITDEKGKWAIYKIVDPSFHNWAALSLAMKDEEISNFPLCNKSFNLSYCGHDL